MNTFRFKKLDIIGHSDAIEDQDLLNECFIDTGHLATLRDLEDSRRIVAENTGTGKSALLSMAEPETKNTQTIKLSPKTSRYFIYQTPQYSKLLQT